MSEQQQRQDPEQEIPATYMIHAYNDDVEMYALVDEHDAIIRADPATFVEVRR